MIGGESSSRPFLLEHQEAFSSLLPARRGALRLAALTSGVTLLIYVLCLPSAITAGWAGEWATAAALDGVCHAPGFSTWTVLAGAVDALLPWGTVPWRVALVSAVATSLACGLLTLWLRQQDVGRRASVAGGMLLGFGSAVWSGAVVPNPHALQLTLTLALFVSIYQGIATRQRRWFFIAGGVFGLGFANHPSFLVLGLIAVGAIAARRTPGLTRSRFTAAWLACFVLGSLPLASLPVRSADSPYLNRGSLRSSIDVPGFVARGFGHRLPDTGGTELGAADGIAILPTSESAGAPGVGRRVLEALLHEHRGVLFVLALVGAGVLLTRSRGDGIVLLVFTGAMPLYVIAAVDGVTVSSAPLGVFLGTAFCGIATLASFALDAALQRFGNGPTLGARSLTGLVACLPLLFIALNYGATDRSRYRLAEDHARHVLESLPRNSVLFTAGDFRTPPLTYVHGVLGTRPDVVLGDPDGTVDWERLPSLLGHARSGERVPAKEVVAALLASEHHAVLSTTRFPLPDGYEWRHYGMVRLAEPSRRISPGGETAFTFTLSDLPRTPPENPQALAIRGAPLDFYDRLIAADYYDTLARHFERTGDKKLGASATRLAQLLRRR